MISDNAISLSVLSTIRWQKLVVYTKIWFPCKKLDFEILIDGSRPSEVLVVDMTFIYFYHFKHLEEAHCRHVGDDTPPGVLLMPSRASVEPSKKVLQCHEESLLTVSCGSSSIQRARGSCITVRILQAMLLSRPDWRWAKRTQGSLNHPPNHHIRALNAGLKRVWEISHCRNADIAYVRIDWTISVD